MKNIHKFYGLCIVCVVFYLFLIRKCQIKIKRGGKFDWDTFKLSNFIGIAEETLPELVHIDLNAEFRIDPKNLICDQKSNDSFLFITFVAIAPGYFTKRNLIRSTWGNKRVLPHDFRILFVIGMSPNSTINKLVEEEFHIHKDILQINHFTDGYFNLSTKVMKSFKWISQYCSNAKYILRINDDVVVNTHALVNHFRGLNYSQNMIYGYGIFGVGPIRDKGSKFYVSEKDYNKPRYNDYIEGKILF